MQLIADNPKISDSFPTGMNLNLDKLGFKEKVMEAIVNKPQDIAQRQPIQFFSTAWLWTRATPGTVVAGSDEILSPKCDFSLWMATTRSHYPPFIVVDSNSFFSIHTRECALRPLEVYEIRELGEKVPSEIEQKILKIGKEWGIFDVTLGEAPEKFRAILVAPVPRLRDPSYLREKNWSGFVRSL